MVSQLIKVPVILKKDCTTESLLKQLGDVELTDEGWVVDFIARVNYYVDDETFIYVFWHTVGSSNLNISNDDLIRFDWDNVKKIKIKIP